MFKIENRGYDRYLLILPGWAFDYRIFQLMDINYNYIFCDNRKFEDGLFPVEPFNLFLKEENISLLSLLGFSKGAYYLSVITKYFKLENIFIVSVRKKFDRKNLDSLKKEVEKNKRTFLYQFYKNCFYGSETSRYNWFKNRLFEDYVKDFSLSYLTDELDNLKDLCLEIDSKDREKTHFFYGSKDKIIPSHSARKTAANYSNQNINEIQDGHMVFLNESFRKFVNQL